MTCAYQGHVTITHNLWSLIISNGALLALKVFYSISAYHSPVAALMWKHHRIILNYYLKYMSGFDAQMLRNVVMVSLCFIVGYVFYGCCFLQAIQVCPEEESILMTSFVDTLAHLQGREGKEGSEFDFQVSDVNGNWIASLLQLNVFAGSPA